VEDVSFAIDEGTIFGFIGPNGAGKTTTMRILATIDLPTRGDAFVGGHSVTDHPDRVRPLLGYMPDRYGTYDDTTVWEYLDFFARAYGLSGAARDRRLGEVMEFAGLAPLCDRFTSSLSKGMQQRVALGRTLLNDPKLLILDEPADGLDPRARIELRELLRVLAGQGKAILISSHILTELSELCDACAIIERGRLLASGKIDDILSRAGKDAELRLQLVAEEGMNEKVVACERLLLEQPGVRGVTCAGAALRVRYSGREADAARILAAVVGKGFRVCELRSAAADLEDAFLSVTQGKLQ
jgi:ABC-2 type transport system ATP-binding protein